MAGYMQQTRRFLWQIDPGFFRLKLAFKTLLAVLISLYVTRDQGVITQMIAALASGFSMQGVVAKDLTRRIAQIFFLSISYFAAFMLGIWARESSLSANLVLILMAFLVNYCRRFDLRYSIAPMMVWMLCFLATVMPFENQAMAFNHVDGLIKGLIVSALVLLFIWPENYKKLFANNSLYFFNVLRDNYQTCAHWFSRLLDGEMHLPVKTMRMTLSDYLECNRNLEASQILTRNNPYLIHATSQQHGLSQAFFLFTEALSSLQRKKTYLPRPLIPVLVTLIRQIAELYNHLELDKQLKLSGDVDTRISLNHLNQCLAELDIDDPQTVMALMNIKISVQLINQHIQRWVTLNEDA